MGFVWLLVCVSFAFGCVLAMCCSLLVVGRVLCWVVVCRSLSVVCCVLGGVRFV